MKNKLIPPLIIHILFDVYYLKNIYFLILPPISVYDHPIHLRVVYDFPCYRQDISHLHGHGIAHVPHSHVEICWTRYVI